MGYKDPVIFEGVYCCDVPLFREVAQQRLECQREMSRPASFLFVGQYITRKNVATLVEAYRLYRSQVQHPWELWCAGQGPLKPLLQNQPGIVDYGYRDAQECAALMGKAGVFVIPSWVDHWPLVIHEATSAGLPVLASQSCGSAVDLVREGYNGYTFPAGDARALAILLRHVSQNVDLEQFSQNSLAMSRQFSPDRWCSTLVREIPMRMGRSLGERSKTHV
jgi:glycosyltransferase involved in cell wall biosynthesis